MRYKKSFLPILVALLSQTVLTAGECVADMDSEFCWPTGKSNPRITIKHLEHDTNRGGSYHKGYYHLGVDISAEADSKVWLVSDGTIISTSLNGWTGGGTQNYALLVRHTLEDGTKFIALYGHLKGTGSQFKKGQSVFMNKSIGVIGTYPIGGDHLHFSLWPNKSKIPSSPYGKVKYLGTKKDPNAPWPSAYGQVAPIKFLKEHKPFQEPEPEPKIKTLTLKKVGDIGWYPDNVSCVNAERWFEVHRVTPVVDPHSQYAWSFVEKDKDLCSEDLYVRFPEFKVDMGELNEILFGNSEASTCTAREKL